MKRLMITAALVASLITLGYAQDKSENSRKKGSKIERSGDDQRQAKTPEQRAKAATDALDKKLTLTADQKSQVYSLNLERAQRMEKAMNSGMADRKEQMKKNKALTEETDKKLSKILTSEQQKSYEDLRNQAREKMKARRSEGSRNKR